MPISEQVYRAAVERAHERKSKYASSVDFDGERVRLQLKEGGESSFSPQEASGLAQASEDAIRDMRLSPLGDTLLFPALQLAFDVPSLVDGVYGQRTEESE